MSIANWRVSPRNSPMAKGLLAKLLIGEFTETRCGNVLLYNTYSGRNLANAERLIDTFNQ